MSTRGILTAGLILVLCLAGVYVYLSATPVGDDSHNGIQPPVDLAVGVGGKTTPVTSPAEKTHSVPGADKPVFDGWKTPAALIMLTGEMHGYVEPCGCAVIQLGGLSRRADLLRMIREEKRWPVAAFDLGGLINRPHRKQAQHKFKFAVDALADEKIGMNYAALTMGIEELKLDLGWLLNKPNSLELLAGNISAPDLSGMLKPFVVATATTAGKDSEPKITVAATAVVGKSLKTEFFTDPNTNKQGDYVFADPSAALKALVPQLVASRANLRILLAHASLEEARGYAKEFPEFHLVVGMGLEDPDPRPVMVGKTLVVSVGHKGKSIGVLGYYPDDPAQPLKWDLIKLDPFRFKNSPPMEHLMRTYQDALKSEETAKNLTPISHPFDADFVGAAKCGECHKKAYAKWKTSKHAQATASLLSGRPLEKNGKKMADPQWIPRLHDPECLACHVTGWNPQEMLPYKTGYRDQVASSHLLGQQCENCHGPGSKHVALEEKSKKSGKVTDEQIALRKARHLDPVIAKSRICVECHDHDNSPEFNFEKYWAEVKHPWRD